MKKVVFLSGTRADFGKIKSLITVLEKHQSFEPFVFVTGMHLMETYGYTLIEIERCNFTNVKAFKNHTCETTMDLTLAKTIEGFSSYIKDIKPDLIVVHGDRIEALAGAIVGTLNNILVAHVEGGEVSGTVDELIRHSVSKMSHLHYVAHNEAKKRLIQMGELNQSIVVIGSPDIDVMFSETLPSIEKVKNYYEIPFKSYGVVMFHPVTTEYEDMELYASNVVNALLKDDKNYVVIYPNNDLGSEKILNQFRRFENQNRFKVFPSIRFEYFLTLLKKSQFIIGNSSAGIREAPYYGIPTINIGTRQENRALHSHIINVSYSENDILNAINGEFAVVTKEDASFGEGKSSTLFIESLKSGAIWELNNQKQFVDIN